MAVVPTFRGKAISFADSDRVKKGLLSIGIVIEEGFFLLSEGMDGLRVFTQKDQPKSFEVLKKSCEICRSVCDPEFVCLLGVAVMCLNCAGTLTGI